MTETLCWSCRNAVPNNTTGAGCSWSRSLRPVEGWTATEAKHIDSGFETHTWHVLACPLFDNDTNKKVIQTDGEKFYMRPPKMRIWHITHVETGREFDRVIDFAKYAVEMGYAKGLPPSIASYFVSWSKKSNGKPFLKYGQHWTAVITGENNVGTSEGLTCLSNGMEFESLGAAARWMIESGVSKGKIKSTAGRLGAVVKTTEPTKAFGLLWARKRDKKERRRDNEKD